MTLSIEKYRGKATANDRQGVEMRNTLTAVAVAIATAATLTGCIGADPTPEPTETGQTLPTTAPTNTIDDGEVVMPPEVSSASGTAALEAASTALSKFAQPDLSAEEWFNQMVPLLSQAAAIAYEGTDPAQIPVRQVTGAGRILEGSTEVSLIVEVPTDVGPYNVTLIRQDATAPWLADRIRPAEG
jgi:hypothetical protein